MIGKTGLVCQSESNSIVLWLLILFPEEGLGGWRGQMPPVALIPPVELKIELLDIGVERLSNAVLLTRPLGSIAKAYPNILVE